MFTHNKALYNGIITLTQQKNSVIINIAPRPAYICLHHAKHVCCPAKSTTLAAVYIFESARPKISSDSEVCGVRLRKMRFVNC